MTPEQEAFASNRLLQMQQFMWAFDSVIVDPGFRIRMRKICEAAEVLREYALEYRGEPVRNIVRDVLTKPPREWQEFWCNPDNIERYRSLTITNTGGK